MLIRKRAARLIRIGINSKCVPYVRGASCVMYDFSRAWKFARDYEAHRTNRLVQLAAIRTRRWVSEKSYG